MPKPPAYGPMAMEAHMGSGYPQEFARDPAPYAAASSASARFSAASAAAPWPSARNALA